MSAIFTLKTLKNLPLKIQDVSSSKLIKRTSKSALLREMRRSSRNWDYRNLQYCEMSPADWCVVQQLE